MEIAVAEISTATFVREKLNNLINFLEETFRNDKSSIDFPTKLQKARVDLSEQGDEKMLEGITEVVMKLGGAKFPLETQIESQQSVNMLKKIIAFMANMLVLKIKYASDASTDESIAKERLAHDIEACLGETKDEVFLRLIRYLNCFVEICRKTK